MVSQAVECCYMKTDIAGFKHVVQDFLTDFRLFTGLNWLNLAPAFIRR